MNSLSQYIIEKLKINNDSTDMPFDGFIEYLKRFSFKDYVDELEKFMSDNKFYDFVVNYVNYPKDDEAITCIKEYKFKTNICKDMEELNRLFFKAGLRSGENDIIIHHGADALLKGNEKAMWVCFKSNYNGGHSHRFVVEKI